MSIKQKIVHVTVTLMLGLLTIVSIPVIKTLPVSADCGGVATAIINCSQKGGGNGQTSNGIWGILLITINILTAGVGIAAVAGIVYGSVLYVSAGGAADQVKKARETITNVVIGIIAYAFMYAFLNFIIPGGLF